MEFKNHSLAFSMFSHRRNGNIILERIKDSLPNNFYHNKFKKIQRNLKDYGCWVTIRKSIEYLISIFFVYKVYRIYTLNLDNISPRRKPNPHGFSFKMVNGNDTVIIKQIENMAEWLALELEDKILNGDICMVALLKEKVVGFNLISFGEVFIPLINLKKVFKQKEAWSEQISVQKDFRKMGIAIELRYRVFEELQKRGIKKLYGGTQPSNVPALRLARKLGFKEILDVIYLKIFNFKKWRYIQLKK